MNIKRSFCLMLLSVYVCVGAAPNTFLTYIEGFNGPSNLAITPNGLYAYIINSIGNSILVVDTNDASPTFNTIIPAPDLIGAFNGPSSVAVTPDNGRAYVTNAGDDSVVIIDTDPTSPTYNQISSPAGLSGVFNSSNGIAIAPNGLYAYVINGGTNTVSVIDTDPTSGTYNTVLNTPALNGILNAPFAIAITPDGNYAYVANLTGSVTVIDVNPTSPTFNMPVAAPGLSAVASQPEGLAITPNSFFAYVADGSGADVVALDTNPASPTFNTVISTPGLTAAFNFPNGVATTADGNYAYVSNFIGADGSISSVSVIDTNPASPTYNQTLNTPGLISTEPLTRFLALAATPNARYVYAVDGFNNNVAVIYTGILDAPTQAKACALRSVFLLETVGFNRITWSAPTFGVVPVAYKIYRDAALTQLIATVPATGALQYDDYAVATVYYIVSVDAQGNQSTPAVATVQQCA